MLSVLAAVGGAIPLVALASGAWGAPMVRRFEPMQQAPVGGDADLLFVGRPGHTASSEYALGWARRPRSPAVVVGLVLAQFGSPLDADLLPSGDPTLISLARQCPGMPETILVPFDGSPLAERALRYAVETVPTASITTIYVIDPVDSIVASETGGLPVANDWYDDAQDGATAVHDAAAAIAAEAGVELESVTEVGRPSRAILDYAEEHEFDHIVMGSHGRGGLDRAILGSVAETVMRQGRHPVTIIR